MRGKIYSVFLIVRYYDCSWNYLNDCRRRSVRHGRRTKLPYDDYWRSHQLHWNRYAHGGFLKKYTLEVTFAPQSSLTYRNINNNLKYQNYGSTWNYSSYCFLAGNYFGHSSRNSWIVSIYRRSHWLYLQIII